MKQSAQGEMQVYRLVVGDAAAHHRWIAYLSDLLGHAIVLAKHRVSFACPCHAICEDGARAAGKGPGHKMRNLVAKHVLLRRRCRIEPAIGRFQVRRRMCQGHVWGDYQGLVCEWAGRIHDKERDQIDARSQQAGSSRPHDTTEEAHLGSERDMEGVCKEGGELLGPGLHSKEGSAASASDYFLCAGFPGESAARKHSKLASAGARGPANRLP